MCGGEGRKGGKAGIRKLTFGDTVSSNYFITKWQCAAYVEWGNKKMVGKNYEGVGARGQ